MATKVLANSGGDYSAWSTYISYLVGLGTFTETETGQVSGEFDGGSCNLTGMAPTSSFRLIIEPVTQFTANPLRYNDGGRVLFNGSSESLAVQVDHVTVRNLAFKKTGAYGQIVQSVGSSRAGLTFQNLLMQTEHNSTAGLFEVVSNGTAVIENCLHIRTAGNGGGIYSGNGSHTFKNCGAISLNSSSGTGWTKNYGTPVCINCYAYGYSTDWPASGYDTTNSKNNATDKASGSSNVPGSGTAQFQITSADFESLTIGTHDIRITSGSTKLKDTGAASGGTTTDIIGQSASGTRDIGPYEYPSGGGSSAGVPLYTLHKRRGFPHTLRLSG